jgi:hypothetical protein
MGIFGLEGSKMKRHLKDLYFSTIGRIFRLNAKNTVQVVNVRAKRKNGSGQKRWYKFAYWQELMGDVFNIYNNH